MSVNTLSLVEAIKSAYPNAGFSVQTKHTISDSLDTLEFDTDTVLDSSTIVAKYEELEAARPLKELREERDRLIAETDWWVLPDRTPTSEQLAYRQALRDITETYSNLNDVVWPTKPE